MEILSRIIKTTQAKNSIKGLQPMSNFPPTTHQQFVDDTMLHGTPMVKEARGLKAILYLFCLASGMDLNLDKSFIFFFNTPLAIQRNVTTILRFSRTYLPSKYLGIPLTDKPWQKIHWEKLLSRLETCCNGRTSRVLNFFGRLTMTKTVL